MVEGTNVVDLLHHMFHTAETDILGRGPLIAERTVKGTAPSRQDANRPSHPIVHLQAVFPFGVRQAVQIHNQRSQRIRMISIFLQVTQAGDVSQGSDSIF